MVLHSWRRCVCFVLSCSFLSMKLLDTLYLISSFFFVAAILIERCLSLVMYSKYTRQEVCTRFFLCGKIYEAAHCNIFFNVQSNGIDHNHSVV